MPKAIALLALCRPGFESETAQELTDRAAHAEIFGFVRTNPGSGFVEYVLHTPIVAEELLRALSWNELIFARQCLAVCARLDALPVSDRLTPLLAALPADLRVQDAWVESPESDEGKELATFCRSFGNALIQGLKRAELIDRSSAWRLHAFFPASDRCLLCVAIAHESAPWPQGIPRLKFPREAPSRSTLKLDEAFQVLMTAQQRERWLKPGMSAVDLGAAPGGWTYQFVRRSIQVIAVDNGPMAPSLVESGLVTHLREDGFTFRPRKPVDWLVCDMVEQPRRVAELIAQWLVEGYCRRAIFNLKLPMKQRYAEVRMCLSLIEEAVNESGRKCLLRAKQLYHDREEVTVLAALPG